jgi:hypothetical protein
MTSHQSSISLKIAFYLTIAVNEFGVMTPAEVQNSKGGIPPEDSQRRPIKCRLRFRGALPDTFNGRAQKLSGTKEVRIVLGDPLPGSKVS